MSDQLPKHPALMARDLFLRDWDATRTAGLDPNTPPREPGGLSMNRGWWDTTNFTPHVALTTRSEGVLGGGNSEYSAIDAAGGGPIQNRDGSFLITIFAEGEREYGAPDATERVTADAIVEAIRSHIEDITIDAMQAQTLPGPWTHAATTIDREQVDTRSTPAVHQCQLTFSYSYMKS